MTRARKLTRSVAEAADVLGVSEWTVRRAIKRGAIPTVPAAIAGTRTLIPVAALEQLIRRPSGGPSRRLRRAVARLDPHPEQGTVPPV